MQGVFNLYGKQFTNSVASAMPSLITKMTVVNLSKLGGATIAGSGANYLYNYYYD